MTTIQLEMVKRACPVCGFSGEPTVFAEADFDPSRWDGFAFASRKLPEYMHYRLISCPVCDLLYANPIPTLEMLAGAYQEADFDSSQEARAASRTYASFLPWIRQRIPDTESALDIGTGDGVFLEQLLAHGFTRVAGVEPSTAPIAAAKDTIRPLIHHGLFSADDFEPQSFSLITCFQTWEHLYEPLQLCQDAFSLLKPGGALFIIGHNRRSLSAHLLKLKSPIFDIEHLQLFSPKSARYILQKSGFQNITVKVVLNRYRLHYLVKLFPLPGPMKTKALKLLENSPLGFLPLSIPIGNIAVIGFKR